jgi:hypothetical protein
MQRPTIGFPSPETWTRWTTFNDYESLWTVASCEYGKDSITSTVCEHPFERSPSPNLERHHLPPTTTRKRKSKPSLACTMRNWTRWDEDLPGRPTRIARGHCRQTRLSSSGTCRRTWCAFLMHLPKSEHPISAERRHVLRLRFDRA